MECDHALSQQAPTTAAGAATVEDAAASEPRQRSDTSAEAAGPSHPTASLIADAERHAAQQAAVIGDSTGDSDDLNEAVAGQRTSQSGDQAEPASLPHEASRAAAAPADSTPAPRDERPAADVPPVPDREERATEASEEPGSRRLEDGGLQEVDGTAFPAAGGASQDAAGTELPLAMPREPDDDAPTAVNVAEVRRTAHDSFYVSSVFMASFEPRSMDAFSPSCCDGGLPRKFRAACSRGWCLLHQAFALRLSDASGKALADGSGTASEPQVAMLSQFAPEVSHGRPMAPPSTSALPSSSAEPATEAWQTDSWHLEGSRHDASGVLHHMTSEAADGAAGSTAALGMPEQRADDVQTVANDFEVRHLLTMGLSGYNDPAECFQMLVQCQGSSRLRFQCFRRANNTMRSASSAQQLTWMDFCLRQGFASHDGRTVAAAAADGSRSTPEPQLGASVDSAPQQSDGQSASHQALLPDSLELTTAALQHDGHRGEDGRHDGDVDASVLPVLVGAIKNDDSEREPVVTERLVDEGQTAVHGAEVRELIMWALAQSTSLQHAPGCKVTGKGSN